MRQFPALWYLSGRCICPIVLGTRRDLVSNPGIGALRFDNGVDSVTCKLSASPWRPAYSCAAEEGPCVGYEALSGAHCGTHEVASGGERNGQTFAWATSSLGLFLDLTQVEAFLGSYSLTNCCAESKKALRSYRSRSPSWSRSHSG